MSWERSLVVIVPAAWRSQALTVFRIIEFDPGFAVPLSNDGGTTLTHYGLHSWVDQATIDKWTNEIKQELRDRLLARGYTLQDLRDLRDRLVISVRTSPVGREHFDAALSATNLVERVPESEPDPAPGEGG